MMNNATRIAVLILSLASTACTSMNSQFECKMKNGVKICASLSEVNQMIDRGQIQPPVKNVSLSSAEPIPLRTAETTSRVWIAPFTDKQGYYHLASEILVTTPGQWKV